MATYRLSPTGTWPSLFATVSIVMLAGLHLHTVHASPQSLYVTSNASNEVGHSLLRALYAAQLEGMVLTGVTVYEGAFNEDPRSKPRLSCCAGIVRGTDHGDVVSGAGSVWRRRRARRGAVDPRERRAERKTSFVKDAIKSNQWIHETDLNGEITGRTTGRWGTIITWRLLYIFFFLMHGAQTVTNGTRLAF